VARGSIRRVVKKQQKSCAGFLWRIQGSTELPTVSSDTTRGIFTNTTVDKNDNQNKVVNNSISPPRFCYLLASKNPKKQNKTYVGVSNNPLVRLNQHNGLKHGGAKRTASGRPWELLLVIDGFPSDSAVLRFEWIWQHFDKSVVMREEIGGKLARKMKRRNDIEGQFAMLKMLLKKCPDLYENNQLTIFFSSIELLYSFEEINLGEEADREDSSAVHNLVCGLPTTFV